MTDNPTKEDLVAACHKELEALWRDLVYARRRAINGVWSIECENIEGRIQDLTKLVGPTEWEAVLIELIEDGVYQRINREVGFEVHPDMARVAEVRAGSWRRG